MMIFKQITFVAANPNCVSLQPVRYNIDTVNDDLAKRKALHLLKSEHEHADRYKLLHCIDVKLHHHVC